MQLVVADTNVLLPGLIDPDSLHRKLLVVFALGKLQADLLAAEDYKDEIEQLLAEHPGAEIGGHPQPGQIVEQARARLARLQEHLPYGTPTEFGLVLSPPLTQEIIDNATGERSVLGNQPLALAQSAVASLVSISATQVIKGLDGPLPPYTEGRDEKDDPIIHTAILANADWLLSLDRKHIALKRRQPTTYTDESSGRSVQAVGLWYFINKVLCTGIHFDNQTLKDIDGREGFRLALQGSEATPAAGGAGASPANA